MSTISKTILSQHTHSGSAAEEQVIGDPAKGDGFYGRSDGIHTVQYSVTDFIGSVSLQATLCTQPENGDWFPVYQQDYFGDILGPETTSKIINFTGNYVWIRAVVDYNEGTVNKILLSH